MSWRTDASSRCSTWWIGTNQLAALEVGSGRVRTLYPVPATASAGTSFAFEAGAAWFVREPPTYQLAFSSTDGLVSDVFLEAGEQGVSGRRVRFRERDVVFRNGEVVLRGTVVVPEGPGPHPAMVVVHGSGPLTRQSAR